jgi:hypothetical protein
MAEIGINFFISALCSLLYLLGSVCFIPDMDLLVEGEWLFIIGSIFIVLSQLWKCYRTAVTDQFDENIIRFRFYHIRADFSGFMVDLIAGFGGLFYAIGTWLFKDIVTERDQTIATHLFVIGGSCFTMSGLFMQYRYFCTKEKTGNLIETEV